MCECECERYLANTICCRLKEEHQPGDDPGDDENGYAHEDVSDSHG